jgi:hypothetical protein
MLPRGNIKRAEFALPGSFYRNYEDEERVDRNASTRIGRAISTGSAIFTGSVSSLLE